jgi:hypothetical protein
VDIQKAASISAYPLAEINRRREFAPVQAANSAGSREAKAENARVRTDDHGTAGIVTLNELEVVLDHLNQPAKLRNEAEEQRAAQYQTVLSARTKHALNAYLAQFDLPQYEAKSTLSQILGVDYYA